MPSGYILTVTRTSPAPTVFLTGVDNTTLNAAFVPYTSPQASYNGGCCYSSYTFNLERGSSAQLSLQAVDSSQNPIGDPLVASYSMSASAPDPIPYFTPTSSSTDGRHVTISFTSPFDNGSPILHYVVRRTGVSAGATSYDYTVNCSAAATMPCGDYGPVCYDSPVPCARDLPVQFTLGANYPPTAAYYIVPTETYTWAIIAINDQNEPCIAGGGSCNLLYGGFSPTSSAIQQRKRATGTPDVPMRAIRPFPSLRTRRNAALRHARVLVTDAAPSSLFFVHHPSLVAAIASPDRGAAGTAVASSTSAISLTWDKPTDNGAAIVAYKTTCSDDSDYLRSTWSQPDVTAYFASTGASQQTEVISGLTPGTTYQCYVAANNSAGGFEPVFNDYFTDTSTDAAAADTVTQNLGCSYIKDSLGGDDGNAPTSAEPSLDVRVRFQVPRPNDAQYNEYGMPNYQVDGVLAPLANYTSGTSSSSYRYINVQHPSGVPYQYNEAYNFAVKPWSDEFQSTDWAYKTCTTPSFRPAAPIASLVDVLDRKVIINWTEPNNHGSAITQYMYQICQGSSCSLSSITSGPWAKKRYMCSDLTTSAYLSSEGPPNGACASMATAGTDFPIEMLNKNVNLQPETPYSIIVRAVNADTCGSCGSGRRCCGIGWASNRLDFTTEPVPSTPTAALITSRAIHLEWDPYVDAYSYEVTIEMTNKTVGNFTYVNTSLTNEVWFTGLTPGLPCTFTVRARKNSASGVMTGPSESTTYFTNKDAPDAVALDLSSLTVEKTNGVTLTFQKPYFNGEPVDGFTVYATTSSPYGSAVSQTLSLSPMASGLTESNGDYTYAITGLTPHVAYSITVTASNSLGEGAPSNAVEYTTCESAPYAPPIPTKLNATTSSIGISWGAVTDPVAGQPYDYGAPITSYNVKVRRWDTGETTTIAVSSTEREFVVPDLLPGRPYKFRVNADNGVGRGVSSQLCSVDTETGGGPYSGWSPKFYPDAIAPEAPNVPTAMTRQGRSLQVTWTPNFDNGAAITAYTVYTNATQFSSETIVRVVYPTDFTGNAFPTAGPFAWFGSSQLTPITPYAFVVTANNSGGESAPSPMAIIVTDKDTPDQLTSNDFNSDPERTSATITVQWNAPRANGFPIDKYEIRYRCPQATWAQGYPACPAYPDAAAAPSSQFGIVLNPALCGSSNVSISACATQYTQDSLQVFTSYEYIVRSHNGYTGFSSDGWSDYSPWQLITTKAGSLNVPPVPGEPTFFFANATSATFSWYVVPINPDPPISRFRITLIPEGAPALPYIWINEGFQTSSWFNCTLTGLQPATNYSFAYAAANTIGAGGDYPAQGIFSFQTGSTAPGTPGTPISNFFTNEAIAIGFTPAPANGYEVTKYKVLLCANAPAVDCAPDSPNWYDVEYDVTAFAATNVSISIGTGGLTPPTGLLWEPGTYYYVRVQGYNSDGYGMLSGIGAVNTAAVPDTPAMPVRGGVINGLDDAFSIHVVWPQPPSYNLAILNYEVSMDGGAADELSGSQNMYIAAGVLPATMHNFSVRAKNWYGWSLWSPVAYLNSSATTPTMNGAPTYTNDAQSQAYTVSVPVASANGYPVLEYMLEDAQGNMTTMGNSPAVMLQRDCNDPAFVALEFKARARNALGWASEWTTFSQPSAKICGIGGQAQAAMPSMVDLVSNGPHSLTAQWSPDPSGPFPSGYQLLFETQGSTFGTTITLASGFNQSYTWLAAMPQTTYTARVLAISGSSYSDYSNTLSATTSNAPAMPPVAPPPTPPDAPNMPPPLPPHNIPDAPGNVTAGPGMPGFDNTTYVHLVWDTPLHDGNLPLEMYQIRATTTVHGGAGQPCCMGDSLTETISLSLPPAGTPPFWESTPKAGYYIASVCDGASTVCASLQPGQEVTVEVSACNSLGCAFSSPIILSTAKSVPGPILTAPSIIQGPHGLPGPNLTTIELSIDPAAFSGGEEIQMIEIAMQTYPLSTLTYSSPPLIVHHPPAMSPATFHYTQRVNEWDYYVKARAVNALGPCSVWSPVLMVPGTTADQPPAPTNLVVSNVHMTTFDISFNMAYVNGSITSYRLSFECKVASQCPCPGNLCQDVIFAAPSPDCSAGCTTSIDDPSVYANVLYSVTLRARNAVESGASNSADLQTLASVPGPPSQLAASNFNTTSFDVMWQEGSANGEPIIAYHLDLSCTSRYGPVNRVAAVSSSVQDFSFTELPQGSNCSVAIQANNTIGWGAPTPFPSNYFTYDAPRVGNMPVQLLTPGLPTATIIHVEWEPPFSFNSPILYYHIKVDGNEKPAIPPPAPGQLPEYMLFGLTPGTTHTFSVRAQNLYGTGDESPVAVFNTTESVPGQPFTPTFELLNGVIRVWVQRASYGGMQNAMLTYEVDALAGTELISAMNYTNYTPPFALNYDRDYDQTYTFRVRAYNQLGGSDWSGDAVIPSQRSEYPPDPINITKVATGQHSIQVEWLLPQTAQAANASFFVSAKAQACGAYCTDPLSGTGEPDPDHEVTSIVPLTACTLRPDAFYQCNFTVGGTSATTLQAYTSYTIHVRAENAVGASGSIHLTEQTDKAAPDPPLNLHVAQPVTNTSFLIEWNVPRRNGNPIQGYVIHVQTVPTTTGMTYMLDPNGQLVGSSVLDTTSTLNDCANLLSSYGALHTTLGNGPQYNTILQQLATGLLSGQGYSVRVAACAEPPSVGQTGQSAFACIGPYGADLPGCSTVSTPPPNTLGVPAKPAPPQQDESPALNLFRRSGLSLSWTLPYDNEVNITEAKITVGDRTYTFDDPYATATFNLTGLPAATQFATHLYVKNALGWSDPSDTTWLTTLPDAPAKPPAPRCDLARMQQDAITIDVEESRPSNGQPVSQYHVEVYLAPPNAAVLTSSQLNEMILQGELPLLYQKAVGSSANDRTIQLSNQTVYLASGGLKSMSANQKYLVRADALNSLGWSGFSDFSCVPPAPCDAPCMTSPIPPPPFPWTPISISLGALIVGLIVCVYCIRAANKGKIFAPKLRKKKDPAALLDQFVSTDATIHEEEDPDLVLNPLFVHKMKMQEEAARRAKMEKKKKGFGQSGGLARLNLHIEEKPHDTEEMQRKRGIAQFDQYLEKEKGVHDASKEMTAYEREQKAKETKRQLKKAAGKSTLTAEEQRRAGLAAGRGDARRANAAARDARVDEEDSMEQSGSKYSETL